MRNWRLNTLDLALKLGESLIELLLLLLVRAQNLVDVPLLLNLQVRHLVPQVPMIAERLMLLRVHMVKWRVNDEWLLVKQVVLGLPG